MAEGVCVAHCVKTCDEGTASGVGCIGVVVAIRFRLCPANSELKANVWSSEKKGIVPRIGWFVLAGPRKASAFSGVWCLVFTHSLLFGFG